MIPLLSIPQGEIIEIMGVSLDAVGLAIFLVVGVLAFLGGKVLVFTVVSFVRSVVVTLAVRHTFLTILATTGIGIETLLPGGIGGALAWLLDEVVGLLPI